jgi:hypothetical protein
MPAAKTIDVERVVARICAGDQVIDIARDLEVTARTIRNRLRAAGYPTPLEIREAHQRSLLDDPQWLSDQVLAGLSDSTIAERLGFDMCASDVRRTRERLNILRDGDDRPLPVVLERWEAGWSTRAIVEQTGIGRGVVRGQVERFGQRRPQRRARRPDVLDDPDVLREWHLDQRLSVAVIARNLGVADGTVRAAMRRCGISTQPLLRRPVLLHDRGWLRQQRIGLRRSYGAIGNDFGVSAGMVRRACIGFRIPNPSVFVRHRPPELMSSAWLHRKRIVEHRTIASIAEQLGVATSMVRAALADHHIPQVRVKRPLPDGAVRLADRDWLERRRLDDRATHKEIARELGVGVDRVRQACRTHNVFPTPRRMLDDRAWLAAALDRNITTVRLAFWFRVTHTTVLGSLARHGVTLSVDG